MAISFVFWANISTGLWDPLGCSDLSQFFFGSSPTGIEWDKIVAEIIITTFVKLQVLGLRLGVDFTFTLDNNHNNHNDNNNPHLNFFKGTVLGVKEQGLGIRDKG